MDTIKVGNNPYSLGQFIINPSKNLWDFAKVLSFINIDKFSEFASILGNVGNFLKGISFFIKLSLVLRFQSMYLNF
jgi:hypothetical protein